MPRIVLFSYPGSPWGAKVISYLSLRGIEYSECCQPMTWPRPDLQLLNIQYRRIPFISIGKDIYYDSSLIFEKLEALYPQQPLGAKEPSGKTLEKLVEKWAEGSLLNSVMNLLPKSLPFLSDSIFLADRKELWGKEFSPDALEKGLTKSLVEIREHFAVLENLLGDGRQWLLDSEKPGLIDIHAAFCFDWIINIPGAQINEFISASAYPFTWRWLDRYRHAIAASQKQGAAITQLTGHDATNLILESDFAERAVTVMDDPTRLQEGQVVALYRIDDMSSSVKHRDVGRLVGLTPHETVVAIKAKASDVEIRVHAPRWQFEVEVAL
ncbi:glutathione S-transferase family protein [Aspergillus saccharolyticus JOP 1030-1]|uniref:GST C-terminal domain-containing protein n=1 Tax=Aspergillus saccharolyticus JOP 1030-1 TaxID=1450539 RepID=A0A318ZH39_9EURO|nr:hypothetical protein BP01DRAFT_392989 [Aspergillus saccharolyticus JOP 1030-1]PYH43893.1 hypothetical protein BP01DRAFT_392989 [Aspergillus saccharolyticus JOP 1030-1]